MSQDNAGTHQQIPTRGHYWVNAEHHGDVGTLADDDFTLAGPPGFILNEQQRLDRCHDGDPRLANGQQPSQGGVPS